MDQIIKVNHLKKQYGEQVIFHDLNMELERGKITCIMGNSGCGKTTLLHILLGLVKPDGGMIEGLEKARFAAVFQENRLCETFDAVVNVNLAVHPSITKAEIEREFEKVGLTDYHNKPVGNLSGGMKRRVAIVRALMSDYSVLVLDEPFKGFDAALKQQMMLYLKETVRSKTVIMVTHEQEEAEFLANKVIWL